MKVKDIEFLFIYIITSLESVYYYHPVVFFPINAKKRHIPPKFIGLTLSLITLGSLILSISYSKFFLNIKTKKKFCSGLVVIIISFSLFGLSDYIENNFYFLIVNLFSRFFQGYYTGMVFTVGYERLPKLFIDEDILNKKIILLGSAQSFGGCMSYFLGFIFFHYSNYAISFLFFSLISFIALIVLIMFYPSENISLMEINDIKEIEIEKKTIIKNKKILVKNLSICQILKKWELSLFILFGNITGISCYLYLPGLSNHLAFEFNLPIFNISLIFFFSMVFSFTVSFIFYILNLFFSINCFIISSIIIIISSILIGPCSFLGFPKEIYLVIIGFYLLFISYNLLINNYILILLKKIEFFFPSVEKSIIISKSSVLNSMMISTIDFLGPLIGGILFDKFGFRNSYFYWSIFIAFFSLLYFLIKKFYGSNFKIKKVEEIELNIV